MKKVPVDQLRKTFVFLVKKRRFHSYKFVQLFDETEGSDYSVCNWPVS